MMISVQLLTIFFTIALAAHRRTDPNATTYKLSFKFNIPAPATLLSEIPCMTVCEREVAYCMKVRLCLILPPP